MYHLQLTSVLAEATLEPISSRHLFVVCWFLLVSELIFSHNRVSSSAGTIHGNVVGPKKRSNMVMRREASRATATPVRMLQEVAGKDEHLHRLWEVLFLCAAWAYRLGNRRYP